MKQAMIEAAKDAEEKLVNPLFQFRNYGQQLPHNWSTISNEFAFGTDYFTRTAVAKSNILVNSPNETKYFYQDLDASGARLNSANRYTVTFAKDGTPPVNGFWSLSIYNEHHFFVANPINRFSVGTKNKDLKLGADGSLTIYVQADAPTDPVQRANWLPAPKGDFSLYVRAYWPKAAVTGRLLDAAGGAACRLGERDERLRHLRLDRADDPVAGAIARVLHRRLAAGAHREKPQSSMGASGDGGRLGHADLRFCPVAGRADLGLCRRSPARSGERP